MDSAPLHMMAYFCQLYFNDCTALLGLITMKPVIRSGHFFLIHDQGHILSNSFLYHKLEMFDLQKITKSYQILPKQA
jgi:hypothetical protein